MNPKQFQALHAHALVRENADIAALHFLPGAMQDADGVYVVLCDRGKESSYAVVSFHVTSDGELFELSCGDRD